MGIMHTRGERAFRTASVITLSLITACAFLPFLLIIATSFTSEQSIIRDGYALFPRQFSAQAYAFLLSQSRVIIRSYGVSIGVTAIGTTVSMLVTTMLAYPMARADFRYRNVLAFVVFFTLLFSGGIVPAYIMWTRFFHITNTYGALIVPMYLMNGFNVLLVRNYYRSHVPVALIESAQIDGAGELRIFFQIMMPLSVPVNVTIGLLTGLAYWNDWINALYYITKPQLYGIQNLLMRIMNNLQFLTSGQANGLVNTAIVDVPTNAVRMSMAVIGILPIMIAYPFLQKYLTRGVVVGAVKG